MCIYFQVNYRNSTTRDPYVLTLPGCNTICEFDRFSSILEKLIPDWDYECFHEIANRQFELNTLSMISKYYITFVSNNYNLCVCVHFYIPHTHSFQ